MQEEIHSVQYLRSKLMEPREAVEYPIIPPLPDPLPLPDLVDDNVDLGGIISGRVSFT